MLEDSSQGTNQDATGQLGLLTVKVGETRERVRVREQLWDRCRNVVRDYSVANGSIESPELPESKSATGSSPGLCVLEGEVADS